MPAPPTSALENLKTLNPAVIEAIRIRFVKNASDSPHYEESDVEMIKQNDWQIQRFLLEHKAEPEDAFAALNNAMKWRKEMNIHQMKDTDFPREFYQSGYIMRYGRDMNDSTVIIFRANIHRKVDEWADRVQKFFIYQIEQIDLNNDGKGVALIIDCSNIGMANLDLNLLKFIVKTFSEYYPKLFDSIIIHELPFLLQYVFKLVQSWLPAEDRKFFHLSKKDNLSFYVQSKYLPSFLNGTCQESWNSIPDEGVLPAKEFVSKYGSQFEIKEEAADKLQFLQQYFK